MIGSFMGGAYGYGAVYELVAGAGGIWTEKVLYSLKGLNDGVAPFASSLVLNSSGNLYGAAWQNGARDYLRLRVVTRCRRGLDPESTLFVSRRFRW